MQDKLKERSASVNSRTLSEDDQEDVARIHRSIDASRTKYEHIKWRSESSDAQETKVEPEANHVVADAQQGRTGDAEQSSATDVEDASDVRLTHVADQSGLTTLYRTMISQRVSATYPPPLPTRAPRHLHTRCLL